MLCAILTLTLCADAVAQIGTCTELTANTNTNALKEYKINTEFLSMYDGLTTDSALGSVMLGADLWNEHGNAGYFRYIGTTTLDELPTDATQCVLEGKFHSIVHFTNDCEATAGIAQARCGGKQFKVTIRLRDSNNSCNERSFGNGAVADIRDLPGFIAHEFGHTMNLQHPDNGERAMMESAATRRANHRQHYEWDFKCEAEKAGKRNLSAYKRTHLSDGSFGGASLIRSGVTKAHAGGNSVVNAAYHLGPWIGWDRYADGSYTTLTNPSSTNGVGFVPAAWRESSGIERVFYSYWKDSTQYSYTSTHRVRQIRSTDSFSSQTAGYLSHCTNTTGWYTCSTTTNLRSAAILSVGYWDWLNRSVVTWTHQDKSSHGRDLASNEVRIAIGSVDNDTLALPTTVTIPYPNEHRARSAVAPGVACKNNFSGVYDCVLVYVPINDLTLQIVARRFSITSDANRYYPSFDSNVYPFPSTSRSSGPVAVWWNESTDRFYAAWRRAASGQNLGVRSSADGITWSFESSGLDDTFIAPSAMSNNGGSTNVLVYAK